MEGYTMTKTSCFLATLVLLCIPYATLPQSSSTRMAVADRSWPAFWRQFTAAINKKDHAALLKVMPTDFSDGGGGLSAKEWLKFIDENERSGSWRDLRKSVAGGARTHKDWSKKGVPTKVTRDTHYYFEFRKDGKWYFAGVVGD
jgi:hypothetical protein